jgi:hypothetical protein
MRIKYIILLAFCLLATPLLAATDPATEDEEAYLIPRTFLLAAGNPS